MENPYKAPAASPAPSPPPPKGDFVIAIPDVTARISVKERGLFTPPKLLIDGEPARKANRRDYALPMRDGTTTEARFVTSLLRPVPLLIVNGHKYPGGPSIPRGYVVLMMVPLLLIFVAGLLGLIIGSATMTVNRRIALSSNPPAGKVLGMLAATGVAIAICLLLSGVINLSCAKLHS